MIIAYGMFILSVILTSLFLFVILVYSFTNKLDHEKEQIKKMYLPFLLWFTSSLVFAQYIWG